MLELAQLEVHAPALRQGLGKVLHPEEEAVPVLRLQVADLALDQAAVGDDVEALAGADEAVLLAHVADELRVPADDAPDVDDRPVSLLRHPLHGARPGGGGGKGRPPVPVGDAGVGGGPARVEAPGGEAAPPGDQGLAIAAAAARLEHQHGVRALAPVAHRAHRDRAADLLVRHRDQHEVFRGRFAARAQGAQRADEGGEAALHVERAGRDQPFAVPLRRHRGEDRVEVGEQQRVSIPDPGPARNQHRLGRTVDPRLGVRFGHHPEARQLGAEAFRDRVQAADLAARRGDGAQVLEQLEAGRQNLLGQHAARDAHGALPPVRSTTARVRRSKTSPGSRTWVTMPCTPSAVSFSPLGARRTLARDAS